MIPKSGNRFSDQIMRQTMNVARKSMPPGYDPTGVKRFSEKAMPQTKKA
jgi:hypothetical protein